LSAGYFGTIYYFLERGKAHPRSLTHHISFKKKSIPKYKDTYRHRYIYIVAVYISVN